MYIQFNSSMNLMVAIGDTSNLPRPLVMCIEKDLSYLLCSWTIQKILIYFLESLAFFFLIKNTNIGYEPFDRYMYICILSEKKNTF